VTDDVRDTSAVAGETDSDAPEAPAEVEDSVIEDTVSDEAEPDSPARFSRWRRGLPPGLHRTVAVVLVLLLLISGGLATWLYFKQYRPDRQTDADVARAVVSAASDGTTALLSYSYDSLDKDFATARSYLGKDFLSYFDQFSQQSVAPVAKQRSMKTTAKVTGAAVSELRPNSAVVLVFVDQVTTTKDSAQPSVAVSSVLVDMTRIKGSWLITQFTPV
jgi:Mce-associated membrane protein